jgi:hypothetical protein
MGQHGIFTPPPHHHHHHHHQVLAENIEPVLLDNFFKELIKVYQQARDHKLPGLAGKLDDDEAYAEFQQEIVLIMCDLQSAQRQLSMVRPEFIAASFRMADAGLSGEIQSATDVMQRGSSVPGEENVKDAKVSELIGYVEVRWNERTEPVCFVLPLDYRSLQDSTKLKFTDSVDLSTTEKRMKELVTIRYKVNYTQHCTKHCTKYYTWYFS